MRLETSFRLSTYLTLGLACLGLGYAEQAFVPALFWFVGPVLLLLAAAGLAEGRRALPAWAANVLAVGIVAGTVGWLAYNLLKVEDVFLHPALWTPALLPYLGPPLMLLLLVKAFRPKQVADYWLLHGMAFLQIVLACILATEPFFGVLLLAYLFGAVWGLTLFSLYRQSRAADQATGAEAEVPYRWLGLGHAAGWSLLAAAAGLVLFLLVPRQESGDWNPFSLLHGNRAAKPLILRTGIAEEDDPHLTGSLQLNEEEALVFRVSEDAEGKTPRGLAGEVRLRGRVLDEYVDGRWRTRYARFFDNDPPPPPLPERLPDLGPGQFFLTFSCRVGKAGGLFLAEPAVPVSDPAGLPVVEQQGSLAVRTWPHWGTVAPRYRWDREVEARYVQATLPADAAARAAEVSAEEQERLCEQPVPEVQAWTEDLLRRLAGAEPGLLTPEDRDRLGRREGVTPASQERVARALCRYLAASGDYTYTLELRVADRSIDPTWDFLHHVKEGHCVRFARALGLMLRSVQVPARLVKGFRGADDDGDGRYVVRHSHAHMWVEALVWRDTAAGRAQAWLTLDPTPDADLEPARPSFLSKWWKTGQLGGEQFWRDFIYRYNGETQLAVLDDLWGRLDPAGRWQAARQRGFWDGPGPWAVLLTTLAGGWLLRRRGRRPAKGKARGAAATVPFYARLLALLDVGCGLRPSPAQTPGEFGEAARLVLVGTTAGVADVPARVVALYYRVRYGGRACGDEEGAEAGRQLDRLERALATGRGARGR